MMGHKQEGIAGQDGGISCDRARELFYDLADAELSNDDRHMLSLHEASCSNCGPEFREWRRLRSALHNSRIAPAVDFRAGVMARIQEIQSEPKPTRSLAWNALWQQGWTRGVAAAAVVLALMAGAARLPAAGSLISWLYNKPQVAVQVPTQPPVKPGPVPGPNNPNGGTTIGGNDNTAKPNNNDSSNPVKPSGTPSEKPIIASNSNGKPGDRVFLASPKRVTTSTTLKMTVDKIDQARSDALNVAQGLAELASETSTQEKGHPMLFLRFTVDPSQAEAFLERLGSLGKVISKVKESVDITDQFASTLQDYQALKAQQEAAPEADKQQYDSRIAQLEQQLQNWDDNSSKQVVLLWLEQ